MLVNSRNFRYTRAQQKDTIRVSNFGAHPYTYENCVTCLQEAISECKRSGARVLSFEKGRYDIWPEGAIRRKILYRIHRPNKSVLPK